MLDAHFEIAAQLDVGPASSHVGGNRDRARHAGIGHDLGFLFMVARIQHLVRNFCGREQV